MRLHSKTFCHLQIRMRVGTQLRPKEKRIRIGLMMTTVKTTTATARIVSRGRTRTINLTRMNQTWVANKLRWALTLARLNCVRDTLPSSASHSMRTITSSTYIIALKISVDSLQSTLKRSQSQSTSLAQCRRFSPATQPLSAAKTATATYLNS